MAARKPEKSAKKTKAAKKAAKPARKAVTPARKAAAKAAKAPAKPPVRKPAEPAKAKILAGGNPQVAKADGNAPVQAYIAAIPDDWKRDIARHLDALITRSVPKVNKAVKWNSPFYGVEGQGWFLNFHCFAKYVKVAFFRGASLNPVPPGASTSKVVRYLDIHQNDRIDDRLLADWFRQAAKLPGWMA